MIKPLTILVRADFDQNIEVCGKLVCFARRAKHTIIYQRYLQPHKSMVRIISETGVFAEGWGCLAVIILTLRCWIISGNLNRYFDFLLFPNTQKVVVEIFPPGRKKRSILYSWYHICWWDWNARIQHYWAIFFPSCSFRMLWFRHRKGLHIWIRIKWIKFCKLSNTFIFMVSSSPQIFWSQSQKCSFDFFF